MKRVAVTGLGFITSIGNDKAQVADSLINAKTGVGLFHEFEGADIPVKLAGTVKGFSFPSSDFEDWILPQPYRLTREQKRPMAPNSVYAYCAMQQAIGDAALDPAMVSDPMTGLMTASGGSMWMAYENLHTMLTRGVAKCPPMGVVNGIPGSLYINLVSCFKILGASLGVSSACASSAHAVGLAADLIRLGRQNTVFVVGAEDCSKMTLLPFAGPRTLSVQTDPRLSPCAFDVKRDGFVGTGGAAVLVLEEMEHALARKVPIYAEVAGWGQSSDGYNVVAPHPKGEGLDRAMKAAMQDAGIKPEDVDYINAHATSTQPGDAAEIAAIKAAFPGKRPFVSSTKSLTGHGLSLAGAMEAAFCCLSIRNKFMPVSANITELDPMCDGVPVITAPIQDVPRTVMSNSSGFGGTNVALVFKPVPETAT